MIHFRGKECQAPFLLWLNCCIGKPWTLTCVFGLIFLLPFPHKPPSNTCFEVFKTRLVSGWRCVVEPPFNSCWDLPVLQQECRRTHLSADHLSFVSDGRLFFPSFDTVHGQRNPRASPFQKPPWEARSVQARVPMEVGEEGLVRMLGLNLGDCMTITADISLSCSQKMLLSAASSVVDHILSRSTYTDVLNWPENSTFLLLAGRREHREPNTKIICT